MYFYIHPNQPDRNKKLPVRRFNIFIGSVILMGALFAAISGIGHPTSKNAPQTAETHKRQADPNALAQYQWHQQELIKAVQAYFEKAIASGEIVGAGVSIVKGDSIVLSDGYGKRNSDASALVNGQTIFRLGSLSKGFAGILAADLETEGKLHWDDKVDDYIPGFQLGSQTNSDNITLANILSHTSGAPYHSYTNLVEAGMPLLDIAERFKNIKPIAKPGIMYSYQNALYALSGEIMQKATGQGIRTLLEEKLFKPLEMCSISMDNESLTHTENVALPHVRVRNHWKTRRLEDNYYNAVAAGGINANALDMARWMRFLLGHNPEVMSKPALEEAFTPFIEIKGHSKYYQRWPGHVSSYYGFGWRIHTFREGGKGPLKTIWHHGGSVNNYRNEIAIFPDSDLGICVLLNNNSRLARTVIPDLYGIIEAVFDQNTIHIAQNDRPGIIPLL